MGNETSHPEYLDPSVPPNTLGKRSLTGVADYIRSGRVRNIVFMVGAGISTSAGIPDFRSPDTGLYANLRALNLPYPEAVFDIGYFRKRPEAFYTLAKELYPGTIRPTITHSFIKLLSDKGLVSKVFTQNIDCLERAAGIPQHLIVEAHGSFATHACIECRAPYPEEKMVKHVQKGEIPYCPSCKGLVKPDIVFFGESLPMRFFAEMPAVDKADLAIVMGTSLSVHPFASLPQRVKTEVPRLLINMERVGSIGSRHDDVVLLEDCDGGVRKLAKALGWLEELEEIWAATDPIADPATNPVNSLTEQKEKDYDGPKDMDEVLRTQVESLTRDIENSLSIADKHRTSVSSQLAAEDAARAGGGRRRSLQFDPLTAADTSPVSGCVERPLSRASKEGVEALLAAESILNSNQEVYSPSTELPVYTMKAKEREEERRRRNSLISSKGHSRGGSVASVETKDLGDRVVVHKEGPAETEVIIKKAEDGETLKEAESVGKAVQEVQEVQEEAVKSEL